MEERLEKRAFEYLGRQSRNFLNLLYDINLDLAYSKVSTCKANKSNLVNKDTNIFQNFGNWEHMEPCCKLQETRIFESVNWLNCLRVLEKNLSSVRRAIKLTTNFFNLEKIRERDLFLVHDKNRQSYAWISELFLHQNKLFNYLVMTCLNRV